MARRLPRSFYERDARAVAPDLLNKVLVHGRKRGRIVEVEAYVGDGSDPGSHAHRGQTPRNTVMFGPPGHLYVYFTYGMHWCCNAVCDPKGTASAVLLRAVEPLAGIDVMRRRRGIDDIYRLTKGPGCLAQAFDIDLKLDGAPYAAGNALWLADDGCGTPKIGRSVRIGITRNAEKPWRFFIRGNRWVSGPAKLNNGPKLNNGK